MKKISKKFKEGDKVIVQRLVRTIISIHPCGCYEGCTVRLDKMVDGMKLWHKSELKPYKYTRKRAS